MVNKITWKHVCYGLVILCVFAFLICLTSCTATKDRKALTRVLGTPELAEKAFKELEKGRPCINTHDTITKTVGIEVVKLDTVYEDGETVYYIDSFETIVSKPKIKYITKTVIRTDTIIRTVEDKRRLDLAISANYSLQGENKQLKEQLKASDKKSSTRLWLLIGTILAGLGIGGFLVYRSLKKKAAKKIVL